MMPPLLFFFFYYWRKFVAKKKQVCGGWVCNKPDTHRHGLDLVIKLDWFVAEILIILRTQRKRHVWGSGFELNPSQLGYCVTVHYPCCWVFRKLLLALGSDVNTGQSLPFTRELSRQLLICCMCVCGGGRTRGLVKGRLLSETRSRVARAVLQCPHFGGMHFRKQHHAFLMQMYPSATCSHCHPVRTLSVCLVGRIQLSVTRHILSGWSQTEVDINILHYSVCLPAVQDKSSL